ncbi:MAG: hypothetical protein GF329_01070 [Candidatus Lokiarchaeota archaeon]|nr:hypothetical protein [Candidatus Lokiarchaeota archaeon]
MNKDSFIEMWHMQVKLGRRVFEERGIDEDDDFLKDLIIAMFVECGELMSELQYKWWKDKKPIDRKKLLEESIDVFHFLYQFWISSGFKPNEVVEAFKTKNKKNFERFFSD